MRIELRISSGPPLTDPERAYLIETLLTLAGDLELRRDLAGTLRRSGLVDVVRPAPGQTR